MTPQSRAELPPPPQKGTLALVALILSVVGLCFFPLGIAAAVMGIIALVRLPPGHSRVVLAGVATGLGAFSIVTSGILAAIAIPNFVRFQARAKQAECKLNLKTLFAAERSFFLKNDRYTTDFAELAIAPERGNRYSYTLDPVGGVDLRNTNAPPPEHYGRIGPDAVRFAKTDGDLLLRALPMRVAGGAQVGLTGACPRCTLTMACVGQVGPRREDIWSVSTEERTANGTTIPPGQLYNDQSGL